jgi:hypothetical protein
MVLRGRAAKRHAPGIHKAGFMQNGDLLRRGELSGATAAPIGLLQISKCAQPVTELTGVKRIEFSQRKWSDDIIKNEEWA